jgi:hypothetical protein
MVVVAPKPSFIHRVPSKIQTPRSPSEAPATTFRYAIAGHVRNKHDKAKVLHTILRAALQTEYAGSSKVIVPEKGAATTNKAPTGSIGRVGFEVANQEIRFSIPRQV